MAIRSLAYVVVDTADVEAWRAYGENVLGMQATDHGDGLRLRMDERPFRMLIRKGDGERFHAAGLVYPDKAAFDRGIAGLRDAGVAVEPASAEEAKDRHVVEFVRCTDPSGNRLHRINGQQKAPAGSGEGWAAVPPATMQAIADSTVDQLTSWLAGSTG